MTFQLTHTGLYWWINSLDSEKNCLPLAHFNGFYFTTLLCGVSIASQIVIAKTSAPLIIIATMITALCHTLDRPD